MHSNGDSLIPLRGGVTARGRRGGSQSEKAFSKSKTHPWPSAIPSGGGDSSCSATTLETPRPRGASGHSLRGTRASRLQSPQTRHAGLRTADLTQRSPTATISGPGGGGYVSRYLPTTIPLLLTASASLRIPGKPISSTKLGFFVLQRVASGNQVTVSYAPPTMSPRSLIEYGSAQGLSGRLASTVKFQEPPPRELLLQKTGRASV